MKHAPLLSIFAMFISPFIFQSHILLWILFVSIVVLTTYIFSVKFSLYKMHSEKDPLTDAYNRNYVSRKFNKISGEMKKKKLPLSVIVIDINDFKHINDKYGHNYGDMALKSVSQLIDRSTRNSDINCRWGGDEFVIICPGADRSTAKNVGHRLSQLINTHTPLSISYGVSTMDHEKDDLNSVIHRADHSMLNRKKSTKHLRPFHTRNKKEATASV